MSAMDYAKYQDEKLDEHEALCKRCGACCGAGNDPCTDLRKDKDGRYYCKSYDNRIGQHLTVSGKQFTCIPIRDVLLYAPPSLDCGYAIK